MSLKYNVKSIKHFEQSLSIFYTIYIYIYIHVKFDDSFWFLFEIRFSIIVFTHSNISCIYSFACIHMHFMYLYI